MTIQNADVKPYTAVIILVVLYARRDKDPFIDNESVKDNEISHTKKF